MERKLVIGIGIITIIFGCSNGQQLKGNQEDPCKTKARVVGDETYCDRYWECVNNQPELYDCPNGLVFAGKHRGVTEGCDYPWRANYCDGKQLANGPISTEHCDWLYGIFGHETSCTRYWTCWNGTATEQLCIGGLLYNENAHSCDWPENVDGCQKHPLCNDDPNGNVALGKSCNRYWQCQGGYPRLQRCPAMLVFDRHSLRCVVPPTDECDVPTTQATPFDEDYNNNNNNNNNGNQSNEAINDNGGNAGNYRNSGNVKFNNNNNIYNNNNNNKSSNRNNNNNNRNNNSNRNENSKKAPNFRDQDQQQLDEEDSVPQPQPIPIKNVQRSRYQTNQ